MSILLLCFIFSAITAFTLYAQYTYYSETKIYLRDRLGNFKLIRDRLSKEKPYHKFSFAIIGDTEGRGMFEEIAKNCNFSTQVWQIHFFIKQVTDFIKKIRPIFLYYKIKKPPCPYF